MPPRLLRLTPLLLAVSYASKLDSAIRSSSSRPEYEKPGDVHILGASVTSVPQGFSGAQRVTDDDMLSLSTRLIIASQQALRLSADWLRSQNHGLWLLLATLMASQAHSKSRLDKHTSLESIRCQVRMHVLSFLP